MDYDEHDATGLAALVRSGEASPRQLVEAALARVEARNPELNAIVHVQAERALAEADGELPNGPFRGVPMLLKDLLAEQKGEPSTYSCKALADWRSPANTELVNRFQRAGFIIIGRTNTPEFGIYGVTESAFRGPCRNPYNLAHTPGGSSGGSAAAVAARIVPVAHARDGGGSIRIPAAHCGLVGLKPSRARNPAGPWLGERWSGMVSEGVVTRSVRDTAAILDATHGADAGPPYACPAPERPFLEEVGRDPGRLRVAFTTQALFAEQQDPENVAAVVATAKRLEALGHDVVEAHPNFDRHALVRAYLTVVAVGVRQSIDMAAERAGRPMKPSDVEQSTWMLGQMAETLSAADLGRAISAMHKAARSFAPFFSDHDVLLTATAARPPVQVGTFALTGLERLQVTALNALGSKRLMLAALDTMAEGPLTATPNTMLWNQTGQPAISLPLAMSATGLPIGVQLVGRYADEATLLRLASQLEAAHRWADRRPTR